MAITKPQLNISEAIAFATEQPISKNTGKGKDKVKITSESALNESKKQLSGLVPENDARLTANIRKDLHLKLKIRAAEQGTTIGELIESLVEKYL
jgi:hypothetical protein